MATQFEKAKYYRSILNVLDVVETCPKNLKKSLKENEYEQALDVLDYNSQWVKTEPLDEDTRTRLITVAKNADKRRIIREITMTSLKDNKVVTVERMLKLAGV